MMITRDQIICTARSWIGTPYCHQASLKTIGCDCLGLVRGVWRELYGEEPEDMPAYSPDWAEAGLSENLAEAAKRHMTEITPTNFRPGDVVLFRWRDHLPAKHAGIVTYDHQMVHAHDGARVSEIAITSWWVNHMAYAFRFPRVPD